MQPQLLNFFEYDIERVQGEERLGMEERARQGSRRGQGKTLICGEIYRMLRVNRFIPFVDSALRDCSKSLFPEIVGYEY